MKFDMRLDGIVARQDELSALLSGRHEMSNDELVRLSKEYAELKPVIGAIEALRKAVAEARDLAEIIADLETEGEMRELAEEEQQLQLAYAQILELLRARNGDGPEPETETGA